jgi:hypothetical protein
MTKSKELASDLTAMMKVMADEDQWPIKFELVERMVDQVVSSWYDEVDGRLTDLIKTWEDKMGDDDKTLYTLGIRRAQDLFRGQDPNP